MFLFSMRTLQEYHKLIKENIGNPGALADIGVEASADFSYYSEIKMNLELEKAEFIVSKKYEKEKAESDAYCQKLWETTKNGKEELKIKFYMKALEKIIVSIKTSTYVNNVEARNQY